MPTFCKKMSEVLSFVVLVCSREVGQSCQHRKMLAGVLEDGAEHVKIEYCRQRSRFPRIPKVVTNQCFAFLVRPVSMKVGEIVAILCPSCWPHKQRFFLNTFTWPIAHARFCSTRAPTKIPQGAHQSTHLRVDSKCRDVASRLEK